MTGGQTHGSGPSSRSNHCLSVGACHHLLVRTVWVVVVVGVVGVVVVVGVGRYK